ncbi:hypothetical protein [Sphingomonas psychrotolerans]|uniref:hypothetical protein n=1 Tax=Sphingomonas psychrotolerans TaxID=1327635 RepID=UPI00130546E6|nr:hypothetical protein [Sphingomonas psychrotolerans]
MTIGLQIVRRFMIVGDETSMGLADAAIHQDPTRLISVCLEVEDVETARHAAGHLRLHDVLVTRRGDNAHVPAIGLRSGKID